MNVERIWGEYPDELHALATPGHVDKAEFLAECARWMLDHPDEEQHLPWEHAVRHTRGRFVPDCQLYVGSVECDGDPCDCPQTWWETDDGDPWTIWEVRDG